jgi:hypothetical protein
VGTTTQPSQKKNKNNIKEEFFFFFFQVTGRAIPADNLAHDELGMRLIQA